jgi:hypothetical protein
VLGHLASDVIVQVPALLQAGERRPLALRLAPPAPSHPHALCDISPLAANYRGRLRFAPLRPRANAGGVLGLTVQNLTIDTIRLEWGKNIGCVFRVEESGEPKSTGSGSVVGQGEIQVDLELLGLPVRSREEAYSFSCMLAELESLRRKGRQKEQTEASSRQVSLDSDDSLDSLLSSDNETASREDKRKRKRLAKKHRPQRAQKIELTPPQVPSKDERLIAAPDSTAVDPDELLIASEATDFLNSISPEILNELSQQLTAEVAEPSAAVAAHDWEELNPTFTTFNLDDTAIGDLTDLPEGVGVLDGEEESVVDLLLPSSDEVDKEPEGPESPVSTAAEAVETMDVFEAEKCPEVAEDDVSSLEPVRVRRKVWIQRTAVPVDESRPLIPQLQSIREKIGANLVEGDISDQFPSLLGQEQVRLFVTWRDESIPLGRRVADTSRHYIVVGRCLAGDTSELTLWLSTFGPE